MTIVFRGIGSDGVDVTVQGSWSGAALAYGLLLIGEETWALHCDAGGESRLGAEGIEGAAEEPRIERIDEKAREGAARALSGEIDAVRCPSCGVASADAAGVCAVCGESAETDVARRSYHDAVRQRAEERKQEEPPPVGEAELRLPDELEDVFQEILRAAAAAATGAVKKVRKARPAATPTPSTSVPRVAEGCCTSCQCELRPGVRFCDSCGAQQEDR